MNLVGASAIVTGGASGLGLATARRLRECEVEVVIVDRDASTVATAESIGAVGVIADVADEDEVSVAVSAACELGPLRALVNCAGIARARRVLERDGTPSPLDRFEFVVRVNLLGTFNCIRLAASAMSCTEPLEDGARGAIVNVASVAAFDGQVGQAAYSASKGGVAAMTLPLARDLAVIGVRVNTIAPGMIDTPIYGSGAENDSFREGLVEHAIFPRRIGRATEFASLTVEMLTNDYMNGEVVRLDGAARLPAR